jgi:hypothetical protein
MGMFIFRLNTFSSFGKWKACRYGWARASSIPMRSKGLNFNNFLNRSRQSGDALAKTCAIDFRLLVLMLLMMLKASGLSKDSRSSFVGLPVSQHKFTEQLYNELNLIESGLAREWRVANDHLSEDAPNGPHIDGLGVPLRAQNDFGSAVPSRGYVLSQDLRTSPVVVGRDQTRQAEVSNLHEAVCIQEDIGWLQVYRLGFERLAKARVQTGPKGFGEGKKRTSVDDVRRMDVFECLEDLVEYELLVHLF